MNYFFRVLRYLRPYWKAALGSTAITVAVALLALVGPWPLKILFDSVLGSHPLPAVLEPILGPFDGRPLFILVVVVSAGFGVTLLANGLSVLNSYLQTGLEQGMILNFRSELFQHTQRLSMAYHDRRRSGGLIFAINFQADAAAGLVMAVQPLVQSSLTLIGMFWLTFMIDRTLAILSLAVVPFIYYSVGYYVTHIQGKLRDVKAMEGESLSIIHEAISMLRVIVAFNRQGHEFRKFREQGQRAVDARVNVTVRQTLFSLAVNTTTAAGTALVMGFGAYRITQGAMTGGELLVVLAYVASIYGPLEAISNTIGSLQDRFISLEMAYGVLDTEPKICDAPNAVAAVDVRGAVSYENLSFSYEGRSETLSDISLEVAPGEVVGIVGPTGAGKTTLVSLLPRFYDADSGRVLLDGRDVRDFTLASLREQISIVLQEPLLFSGSVADNIRYGRMDATIEEVWEAARSANAAHFIENRLPDGIDTELGERGVKLSGGERQRISIARAFLKDAPLLVLDEPTSAIDSRTEAVILKALERLMAGRTTFMIAHRLSTIRYADRIVVMDEGRIVEQGEHDELLRRGGLYEQLHRMQTSRPAEAAPAERARVVVSS